MTHQKAIHNSFPILVEGDIVGKDIYDDNCELDSSELFLDV